MVKDVKPHILLRTASVLSLLHALLNTFAGLLSGTSGNQEEVAVLNAMKTVQFDAMGSLRTYWDFYFGFGLFLTLNLLLIFALLWQLASLAKTAPAIARPFIGSFCIAFAAFAILSGLYFFIAPLILEILIAVLLGLAYACARR
ncbi:MAG: LIC_13387 family protein [Aestuariivirga sp.]